MRALTSGTMIIFSELSKLISPSPTPTHTHKIRKSRSVIYHFTCLKREKGKQEIQKLSYLNSEKDNLSKQLFLCDIVKKITDTSPLYQQHFINLNSHTWLK